MSDIPGPPIQLLRWRDLQPTQELPAIVRRRRFWVSFLAATVIATLGVFLPAYDFLMGADSGGDISTLEAPIRSVPDMTPFCWWYLGGLALLMGTTLLAILHRPTMWMLPLIATLAVAPIIHVAKLGDEGHRGASLLPKTARHGGPCTWSKPHVPSGRLTSEAEHPDCGANVLGPAGREAATSIVAAHPEFDSIDGYGLRPAIGIWIVDLFALGAAIVFSYLTFRLWLRPRPSAGAVFGILALVELYFLINAGSQLS